MSKVAYTTGTFDLVHSGHFELLSMINFYGYDRIIVGLVSDQFARQRKRATILSYNHRKAILENSKYNVMVVQCNQSDKIDDYERLKYDALFIGDDYYGADEYKEVVAKYPHVKMIYLTRGQSDDTRERISTTDIIEKMTRSVTYISATVIKIKEQYIKITDETFHDRYDTFCLDIKHMSYAECFTNKLIHKGSNVYWWYVPILSQEKWKELEHFMIKHNIDIDII
jgi:cytidyltransferase-like protein